MKFVKYNDNKSVTIPPAVLTVCGLDDEGKLEMAGAKGAVILSKSEMTAMEMVRTILALTDRAGQLMRELTDLCGSCEGCTEGHCTFRDADIEELIRPAVTVPDWAREEADIAPDAKLDCHVDEGSGVITVCETFYDHDLSDIPAELLEALRKSGCCLSVLEDKPEIIPEEAEVVRWIYERYLAGASTRMLRDELHEQGVIYSEKSPQWTLPHIKSILRNEKYCGDVLMQKTFQQDVINRKVIKNTGQLPMYLIENHHEGIVSREKYNAVQAEMARRKAAKSPSKRASTGLAAYTSRYALSDRLVCGECGTLYRRCTWTRPDGKRVVWRCVSRLDYGKKYCHSSPTLDEAPLQQAIIAALNTVLPDLGGRIRQITEALEAEVIPFPGSGMSLGDIDRRLAELEAQFQRLLEKAADDPIAYGDQFKEILDEQTALKELRATILAESKEQAEADRRIRDAAGMLENAVPHIAEWDESAVRQLVAQVKVLSKNEISVTLKSGIEIRQSISN